MSLIIDIADALTAELNAPPQGTFIESFSASREYRPQFELADLKNLRVTVVPRSIDITSITRDTNQHDVSIDVAVQKKIVADDPHAMDDAMRLVEQVADYVRGRRLTECPCAAWTRTENAPIYSPEHLERHQVFTSVLTLTFRVVR